MDNWNLIVGTHSNIFIIGSAEKSLKVSIKGLRNVKQCRKEMQILAISTA